MLLCSRGPSKMHKLLFLLKIRNHQYKNRQEAFFEPLRGDLIVENKGGIATKAP